MEEIAQLLSRLEEKGTHRFQPTTDETGRPTKPIATATIYDPVIIQPNLIHARIAIGEEGSHISATKPDEEARSLEGWSPEAAHEVTFIFPNEMGSEFLLVTQTNHRRDPRSRLTSMLKNESMVLREERIANDRLVREQAKEEGRTVPKKKTFKRLVFTCRQASDNEYLDELLAKADKASVVFKSKKMDAVGNTTYVDRVLQIKLRNENISEIAGRASKKWVKSWRAGETITPKEAVLELGDLLEEHDLIVSGEEQQYESAAISLQGKTDNATTTIAADTMRDAFTYPLSDLPPTKEVYCSRAFDRVHSIARQENIEIELADPIEVAACLTESVLAVS